MNDLPPIPTPLSARWHEFRVRFGPIVFFIILVSGAGLLWQRVSGSYTLLGLGEGVRSLVSSPYAGLIQELKVNPFQMVNQGDPIIVVRPVDPRAPLDLLQSELVLERMRNQPSLAEENAMSYERIRVELLRNKSELAMARANLELAENQVRRNAPLYKERLVSEDVYDQSLKARDLYRAEVEEKAKAVAEIECRMEGLRSLGDPQVAVSDGRQSARLERLEAMQAAAATNWSPITLTAPISGMVSLVFRQPGEHLVEGEPLVVINSQWSDRVVGYLRQPYSVDPKVGMKVRVTTRNRQRQEFQTEISKIGAQIEVITNSLAFMSRGCWWTPACPS
jgi:multidrug resistance efflux pump